MTLSKDFSMRIQMTKKRPILRSLVRFLFFALWVLTAWGIPVTTKAEAAKNVIVMIPDGCSFEQYTLARWYKGSPLAMDTILAGAVKTYTADSVVADSAPAASAYATGVRTSDKFISVAPKTEGMLHSLKISGYEPYQPLATVLEAAKLTGRAVGVVSTSRVTHATPVISDLLIFDEAVRIALDFAGLKGDTLLLVMPDHNTGGMSIGNWATSQNYFQMKPDDLVGPLKKMKASSFLLSKKLQGDSTPDRVIDIIRSYWGLNITSEDAQKILEKMAEYPKDPYYAFGEVLSPKYLYIGWSTHGHCGGDVPLGAFGPNRPSGLLDAPEIAQVVAEALQVDLEAMTHRLLVDASAEFGTGNVMIDSSDPDNSVIRITHGEKVFLLPANKNLIKSDDRVYPLEGVTILIPETQKAYIPRQAVEKIKGIRAVVTQIGRR